VKSEQDRVVVGPGSAALLRVNQQAVRQGARWAGCQLVQLRPVARERGMGGSGPGGPPNSAGQRARKSPREIFVNWRDLGCPVP